MRILIHFELRKIFSKKLTQIALIAILLLSVLFGFPPTKTSMRLTEKVTGEQEKRQ